MMNKYGFKNKQINTLLRILLWNNHFYGICVAGLAISSALKLTGNLPSISFLMMAYISTVVYYTNAYFKESLNEQNRDRSNWYLKNKNYLKKRQGILMAVLLILISKSVLENPQLLRLDIFTSVFLAFSLIFSILYNHTNLKKYGILKSLAIAFVWTILGGYMPLYFNHVLGYSIITSIFTQVLYLIQLFLFILLLAVLFDIKDMQNDEKNNIRTIPIQFGLERIKKGLIWPFIFISVSIDIIQSTQSFFSVIAFFIQGLFYLILYWAALLAIKEKSISKSILLIDGLMIVKSLSLILLWYFTQSKFFNFFIFV